MRFVPVNRTARRTVGVVLHRARVGQAAVDACTWPPANHVEPDRIRWVRPREAWFLDRAVFQPLEQVGGIIEGLSLDAEAAAQATDVDELFRRLDASGRVSNAAGARPDALDARSPQATWGAARWAPRSMRRWAPGCSRRGPRADGDAPRAVGARRSTVPSVEPSSAITTRSRSAG